MAYPSAVLIASLSLQPTAVPIRDELEILLKLMSTCVRLHGKFYVTLVSSLEILCRP